ncbi:hypothetical protein [Streptomyces sp. NPDC059224]|uniref:hypothetical protein n=1 Tax=Streptomyces sp. NPDC059224 TaxID=3346775 RepID=UPI0036BD6029
MTITTAAVAARSRAGALAGTAAVVAPDDSACAYLEAFARHGWRTLAVTSEAGQRPLAYRSEPLPACYGTTVVHRGLRQTVKTLRAMGVTAVLPGSAEGIELAERISWHLHLPGGDPASSPLRRDRGMQASALVRHGLSAPRSVRTASLSDALDWAAANPLPGYLLAPAATGVPVDAVACATGQHISLAWPAMRRLAAIYSGDQSLCLTESLPARQYLVTSTSRPGPDQRPEHSVYDVWAEVRSADGQMDRADLLDAGTLLTRALSLATVRALDVLGVVHGPVTTRLAYRAGEDEDTNSGPMVIAALAAPAATPADTVLRTSTGRDRTADVLDAWIPPAAGQLVPAASRPRTHVTRVHLSLPDTGLPGWLEEVLHRLPTAAAVHEYAPPSPSAAAPLSAEVVLASTDPTAIEDDYQVIRALESSGPALRLRPNRTPPTSAAREGRS